jgi:hypothetical protein
VSAFSNAYWAANFTSNYVLSITRGHPGHLEAYVASYQFSHWLAYCSSLVFTESFCGYAAFRETSGDPG